MKIGDVKVGGEYGVVQYTGKRDATPKNARRARIETIEEKTERVYKAWGPDGERKVKNITVIMLDDPKPYPGAYAKHRKGDLVAGLSGRNLLGTWDDISPHHEAAWKSENDRNALRERIESEVESVGLGGRVSTLGPKRANVTFDQDEWAKLLSLIRGAA